jgi:hypothetical protein
MKKIIIISLIIVFVTSLFAATVTLSWNNTCDTNIVGYYIKWGYVSPFVIKTNIRAAYIDDCNRSRPAETNYYRGIYTNAMFVSGYTNTTCTISNLLNGIAYAFVATRTNNIGLESDVSEEVIAIMLKLPSAVEEFKLIEAK